MIYQICDAIISISTRDTVHIVRTPTPPPTRLFLLKGRINFKYFFPRMGRIWKIKKRGGGMVQGQVFLKGGGGWHFSYLTFLRFIIFAFRNYLIYSLQNCVMHLKKKIFFCHCNFMKKVHSKLSKMNLKISYNLREHICKGI